MTKEQEAEDIFNGLRTFAQKYDGQLLCIISYPIEGQSKSDRMILLDNKGLVHKLIRTFLELNKKHVNKTGG